jgi:hypothetical protein
MPPLDPKADRPFWPRNPYPIHPRPRSVSVFEEPLIRHPTATGEEGAPSRWSPYALPANRPGGNMPGPAGGLFVSRPYGGGAHDQKNGALNEVARGDMTNSAVGPWPRSGVWDEPNVWPAVIGFLRLPPSTSAHMGKQLTSGEASPTMVFHTPPVWGLQTTPIYAVGV